MPTMRMFARVAAAILVAVPLIACQQIQFWYMLIVENTQSTKFHSEAQHSKCWCLCVGSYVSCLKTLLRQPTKHKRQI